MINLTGHNTTAIVILLVITLTTRGAFFGGSYLNHVDLGYNYVGTLSGMTQTLANTAGIFSPLVTGFITQGQVRMFSTFNNFCARSGNATITERQNKNFLCYLLRCRVILMVLTLLNLNITNSLRHPPMLREHGLYIKKTTFLIEEKYDSF
jgi:hypothetical protein